LSCYCFINLHGPQRAEYLIRKLIKKAHQEHVVIPGLIQTHYINSIEPADEPPYPGDEELELRIRRIIRWNAVAMVMNANKISDGIGGHLATYASAASLYEVGFNHFFKGKTDTLAGDQIYFQGHAAPGIYARAFLEGRLSEENLMHFRREGIKPGVGLSSYPHPRLMEKFWEFPTVSMGLGPISAIYQARFNRYLHARSICDTSQSQVWCFIGDGECDEVETIGAIDLASREKLDNLTFVINCNLQRLDGPVRGNGKIVQELEGHFRGMGWNVIKVLWGRGWDELLANDTHGLLVDALDNMLDGEAQIYSISTAEELRKNFFGRDPRLLKMVKGLNNKELRKLRRGGHDYNKVYAAYDLALKTKGKPTVILAQTVKGWTLGKGIVAKNVTHSKKKMSEAELKKFRDALELPIKDSELTDSPPFYHPGKNSKEVQYIMERRRILGGFVPERRGLREKIILPGKQFYAEFSKGTPEGQAVSTTMAFVRILTLLMRDKNIGDRIVPIIPDEARTFGMHTLFPEFGIYSPKGQLYRPVDKDNVLYYREVEDGQILEEGITEAGSMASFQASGTSYATHNKITIPFYVFYSMFGLQRTGDQVWQFADIRGKGFLIGATSGRTTLNGEGLQHQDGHSHILASTVPNLVQYDPAFAYELAVIIESALKRMYEDKEDIFYYITVANENYRMYPMPENKDVKEGILKGIYLFKSPLKNKKAKVQILGSGVIINEAIAAQEILEKDFNISSAIYSVTSYTNLRDEALELEKQCVEKGEFNRELPYILKVLGQTKGPIIAASDHMKAVPDLISRWLPNRLAVLGTDGFGMSDDRKVLRAYFKVDAANIVKKTLFELSLQGEFDKAEYKKAVKNL